MYSQGEGGNSLDPSGFGLGYNFDMKHGAWVQG